MNNELKERIAKDNARYEAASPKERRVIVAREVLRMLESGTFGAGAGYARVTKVRGKATTPNDTNIPLGDLQIIVRQEGFHCIGCAKGAAIMARAAVGNSINLSSPTDSCALADQVSEEVFGHAADIIEGLYEDWYPTNEVSRVLDVHDAIDAYEDMRINLPRHRTQRMRAIYQNIIDNDGDLKVGDFKF